jgi:putative hydrolase of the HAD superfamily
MAALRDSVLRETPALAKDVTGLRKAVLARAAREAGDDEARMGTAFEVFLAARNEVEFYPDALPALRSLNRRYKLGVLSNGNADIARIGLSEYFGFTVSAPAVGEVKPHPATFEAAIEAAGVARDHLLHVGDDPSTDIGGAVRAGIPCVWVNRERRSWPAHEYPGIRPDAEIHSLSELPALAAGWGSHG